MELTFGATPLSSIVSLCNTPRRPGPGQEPSLVKGGFLESRPAKEIHLPRKPPVQP